MRRQYRLTTVPSIQTVRPLQLIVALPVLACCAFVAACGSSSTLTAGCASRVVTLNAAGTAEAGKCPTDTAITIDRTAFGQGPQVGTQVASEVVGAAGATLANGGLLSVVLYGRDADRAVTVYQGSLPTAAQEDQFGRSEQTEQVETAIRAAVANAFAEPARQTPEMRQATALLEGEGSDIARSLREAVHAVSRGDGNATAVVDLTDGLNATAQLPLLKLIERGQTGELGRRLAVVAGMGDDAKVGLIAIPTVGQVPQQYQSRQSPELTDRLVSVWEEACRLLHPGRCAISTTI
jgi:hypothetical protein